MTILNPGDDSPKRSPEEYDKLFDELAKSDELREIASFWHQKLDLDMAYEQFRLEWEGCELTAHFNGLLKGKKYAALRLQRLIYEEGGVSVSLIAMDKESAGLPAPKGYLSLPPLFFVEGDKISLSEEDGTINMEQAKLLLNQIEELDKLREQGILPDLEDDLVAIRRPPAEESSWL